MSPSMSTPQDAYRIRGAWHCTICDARGKGGMDALHAHYMTHHWHEVTQ